MSGILKAIPNTPTAPFTFLQTANPTTLATVPAAVTLGALVLLSDVITALGTVVAAVNANRQLINALIDTAQANAQAG